MTETPPRSRRRWIAVVLLVTVASLVLRTGFPVSVNGWASHDDGLFIDQATTLASGQWLGPFGDRTLAKGAMYPIFIATLFTLGIPLKLGEQLVYLAVCALAAGLVARASGSRGAGLGTYALLAFNPYLWSPPLSRVIRENLYLSLTFALILLLAAAFSRWRREGSVDPGVAATVLVAGLVAGAYWLTREERPWIVPTVATLVAAAALHLRWSFRRDEARRERLLLVPGLALALLFALGLGVAVGSVAWRNEREYGAFLTNEFREGAFGAATGALKRVGPAPERRFVRFPRENRLMAYAASPAAAELRPTFEGEAGEGWRRIGCEESGNPDCSEFLAGWFSWVVRDAVARAGHYSSAGEAQAFYRRIAEEIGRACDSGELDCRTRRGGVLPRLGAAELRDTVEPALRMVGWLLRHREEPIGTYESEGTARRIEAFRTLVGPVAPRGGDGWVDASGWFARVGSPPRLGLRRDEAGGWSATLTERPAPDVEEALGVEGLRAVRFDLATSCVEPDCALVLDIDADDPVAIRPTALRRGPIEEIDGFRGHVDRAAPEPPAIGPEAAEARRAHRIRRVARPISALYAALLPWASFVALVGLVAALVVRRGRAERLELVLWGGVALVAVASRVGMLAVLAVTWLPVAPNALYLSPASPFFLFAVACGLVAGARTVAALRAPAP